MDLIDAQVHAYERDHPSRPWAGALPGPSAVTADDLVAAMDEVDVSRAILVSPWTLYREDTSYAVEVYRAYPDRVRLVAPIVVRDHAAADIATAWASTPGAVGIRLMAGVAESFQAGDAAVAATVRAAESADFPVSVYCPGPLGILDELAQRHPDTQFVLDHLGLAQPLTPPPPDDPFAGFDQVLALARYPNIAVKVSAACTLSHRPFPFQDLWGHLGRLFEAFGIDRCLWGTDWTRCLELVTYPEAVAAFRDHLPLTLSEREVLLGGAAARIFRWSRHGSGLESTRA